MGDQKIAPTPLPPPPPEWASSNDDPPDQLAKDDNVAAKLKHEEHQVKISADDRYVATDQPREMQARLEKVAETSEYRGAQPDDELARRARALKEDKKEAKEENRDAPVRERDPRGFQRETVGKVEERIGDLVQDMIIVIGELDKQDVKRDPGGLPVPSAQMQERLDALIRRLAKIEFQTKQQLQVLLSGGVGLNLAHDPRITFKRVFDRFKRWPRRMRPGRRPETDADFDEFIAWVFEPPELLESDEESNRVWVAEAK